MGTAIRVLIVDDSEDDALLLAADLTEGGLDIAPLRVDTPEEMRAALLEEHWDIIIADYRMPRFSGPDALRLLQDTGLDIPLILVSGTAEEHTGVEMMLAGAADFIMKHGLGRLVPAVKRELGEADSRLRRARAESAAKSSAENYRMLFKHAPSPIVAYDRNAVVLQVNPAFEQAFGFTAEEVIGRHKWEAFALPMNTATVRDQTSRIFSGEIVRNAEYDMVAKDGRAMCVLVNITPVSNEHGEVTMALAMMTDITERKEAEAHKRDFYRRTILAATDGKLVICEKEEIDSLSGEPLGSWTVTSKEELAAMRDDVCRIAQDEGMDGSRVPYLLSCMMEAAANAVKHANGGTASLSRTDDSLIFTVSDSGPGIGALALPDVALVKGYSTGGTLGMGYKIIIQSADMVYLATGSQGTTVAAELGLSGPVGAEAVLEKLPGW